MKPLRILQIGTGMPRWAGTEKYILDLAPLLAARGHEVVIACRPESEIDKRAQHAGIPVVHLTMRHTQDWAQLPRFSRAMRGFDVVHIHSYIDYIVPAAAARVARVPVVVMTRHLPHPFASRFNAYVCSQLFYDGIIAISDYVAGVLKSSGVKAQRIFTVRNAVDPDPWSNADAINIREQLGISSASFLVASAGRLVAGKGFEVLLRAIGQLRKEGIDVNCVIAGPGDTAIIEAVRAQEGLESCSWLLGFRRDMPGIYAAADAVVVPSQWAEPFGYSAIEGLAAGKPVIASRVGGLPEIVTPESGILVPPGDVEALAEAVKRLISDPALRRSLAAHARERGAQFPMQAWASGIEAVYYEILGRNDELGDRAAAASSLE